MTSRNATTKLTTTVIKLLVQIQRVLTIYAAHGVNNLSVYHGSWYTVG